MMDQLLSLRVFCTVVELGSFVAAAERLTMSTSMVSKYVMNLEARLGVRLLNRTSRRLSLTDVGQSYWESVRRLLDDLDEADTTVSLQAHRPRGWLKVTAPSWFAVPRFVEFLEAFRKDCPEVSVDLDLSDRRVDLVEEGFDLALRVTVADGPFEGKSLADIPFSLVASPGYLDGKSVETLADLGGLDMLDYAYVAQGDRFRYRDQSVAVRSVFRSNSTVMIHQMAIHGLGVALLPTWLSQEDLAAGRLMGVLPKLDWPVARLYAVDSGRRHQSARTRAFLNHLQRALSDGERRF